MVPSGTERKRFQPPEHRRRQLSREPSGAEDPKAMRYDFSAHFLRILPPDTSFGEAWESLCFDLLRRDMGAGAVMRLNPPDKGVDLLARSTSEAYQCKSDERGAFGTLNARSSVDSLRAAVSHKEDLFWSRYRFSTNANYSGTAVAKILAEAQALGISRSQLDFLGPEHWDDLCTRYSKAVHHRFNYRVSASHEDVVEAFRKAKYFDRFISEYDEKIRADDFPVVITNNRTAIEIEIPFSRELSVENFLDVGKVLLGISLDRMNYPDLGTSAGPSISVTIDRRAQPFSKKIVDLPISPGEPLNIWIKVVWRDEPDDKGADPEQMRMAFQCLRSNFEYDRLLNIERPRSDSDRRQLTVSRTEQAIQGMTWSTVHEKLGDAT
jgi:hypothetical protein